MSELQVFTPKNKVETSLLQASDNSITLDEFFTLLVDSRIILRFKSKPDKRNNFYFLDHVSKGLVLVLFTSKERVIDIPEEYSGQVEVDFRAVFDIAEGQSGFIINPGWQANMVASLECVTDLINIHGK